MKSDSDDANEIETLYRQHGPALLLFATAMTRERSRAQDAVHQVFLRLIELGNVRSASSKKSYLFASVRNAVLNDAKLQRRNTALDPDAAWFTPPDRDYAGELNLRRAICALPDDQREVVTLHIWADLTFAEIGEVLAISANTAATRYRYALTKLRASMPSTEDCYVKP